jgi:hypothetical protein
VRVQVQWNVRKNCQKQAGTLKGVQRGVGLSEAGTLHGDRYNSGKRGYRGGWD